MRKAPIVVVCDGQSLNLEPGGVPMGVETYPYKLKALIETELGYTVPFVVPAIGAQSWTRLYDSRVRATPHAYDGLTTVWIGVGGTADIRIENDTGAELYADNAAYAQAMTTAGYTHTIATTTTKTNGMTAGQLTNLADGNTLILADSLGAFTDVVDLCNTPGLDDPAGADYSDGVHWSDAGTTLAAATVLPTLLTVLGV